jgi:hypothetical protein
MKILERNELSVVGICPHCGSWLALEKGDVWWNLNLDGSKSPCVTCAACDKGFDVEGWKNIHKIL